MHKNKSAFTKERILSFIRNLYTQLAILELEKSPEKYISTQPFLFDFEKLDVEVMNYLCDNISPQDVHDACIDVARQIGKRLSVAKGRG